MAVSRRLRFEILRRDGHTCRYCGAKAPDVVLTVDHVIPTALGGGDEPNNLVTACQPCNAGKSSIQPDSQLVEDVDAAALLFAKAMETAAAWRRGDRGVMDYELGRFDDAWSAWTYTSGDLEGEHIDRDDDWRGSVQRFIENGLDFDQDIRPLIKEAMEYRAGDTWRFFCHLCWKEIGIRQEMARRIIEDGGV